MKKLMAILATMLLAVPMVAKADTWYTYTPGQEVNFYTEDTDETGKSSIILSDEGGESQYVKAWFFGAVGTSTDVYFDTVVNTGDRNVFEQTNVYPELKGFVEQYIGGFAGHAKDITKAGNLGLITLDELKTVFEAKQDGENYTIDVAKYGTIFEKIVTSKNIILTQTVEGDYVWVVEVTTDANQKATAITVKKIKVDAAETMAVMVPVVYVDKTYDCTERQIQNTYACYECGEEYTWAKIGEQAEGCKKLDKITSKSKCVKNAKTGIEEYILEFVAVAGVCGVALVIAKRKDLFRSI